MPSPTKSTRVASVQRTSMVVLPCEKVARPPVSRKRKTTQPSANCESTKTMPVIRNVRANCWSISRPNDVIGSGGRQYFAAKRYDELRVKKPLCRLDDGGSYHGGFHPHLHPYHVVHLRGHVMSASACDLRLSSR